MRGTPSGHCEMGRGPLTSQPARQQRYGIQRMLLLREISCHYNGSTKLRAKATGEISMIDSYGDELIGSVQDGTSVLPLPGLVGIAVRQPCFSCFTALGGRGAWQMS